MAYIRIYLNDVLLEQIELGDEGLSLGRSPECDLVIDSPGVSSHHASIEKRKGLYVLIDNNSTNGVYVNGKQIKEQVLNYRDEIQLHNYVLKFMATAGLADHSDPDIAQTTNSDDDKTMEIPISGVAELLELRNRKKVAYLEVLDTSRGQGKNRIIMDGNHLSIGRSKSSDLRISSWFAPAVAAEIEKRHDGYYLAPKHRAKAKVNNKTIKTTTRLADGDRLQIRNLKSVFRHHIMNPALS